MAVFNRVRPGAMTRWLRLPRPGRFGGGLGVAVLGLGLLVIGLGWAGAAGSGGEINHVPNLSAQLPYLISGGGLGLAFVALGATLMLITAHRQDRASLEARLESLLDAVSRLSVPLVPAPRERHEATVVAGSASFHTASCRLVEGRTGLRTVSASDARAQGLRPCRICQPVAEPVP
ncbi:MAG: hypothetical protein ACYCO3_08860 [Mycobacteriales bacterium]